MNCYLFDIQNKEQILHTHWHTEWEFFYVANGSILFQLDEDQFVLNAGEAAVIPPEKIHAGFAIDHGSCNFEALVFHSSLLAGPEFDAAYQRYISPILVGDVTLPKKLRPDGHWQSDIICHIHSIIELMESQIPTYELQIKSLLFMLFAHLTMHCTECGNPKAPPDRSIRYREARIQHLCDYIRNNYGKKLTIESLSKVVSLSPIYLCRFFKEITGQTITDYINHYRTAQAALLIRTTDKKLLDIALETGFNNLSYFSNQFKRYLGVTPSEFKEVRSFQQTESGSGFFPTNRS